MAAEGPSGRCCHFLVFSNPRKSRWQVVTTTIDGVNSTKQLCDRQSPKQHTVAAAAAVGGAGQLVAMDGWMDGRSVARRVTSPQEPIGNTG